MSIEQSTKNNSLYQRIEERIKMIMIAAKKGIQTKPITNWREKTKLGIESFVLNKISIKMDLYIK